MKAPIGVDVFGLEIEAPIPEDFGEAFSYEEVLEFSARYARLS